MPRKSKIDLKGNVPCTNFAERRYSSKDEVGSRRYRRADLTFPYALRIATRRKSGAPAKFKTIMERPSEKGIRCLAEMANPARARGLKATGRRGGNCGAYEGPLISLGLPPSVVHAVSALEGCESLAFF